LVSGRCHALRDGQLSKATDADATGEPDGFSESLPCRFRSGQET